MLPQVVIFSSANPDFFLSHVNFHLISANQPVPRTVNSSALFTTQVENTRLLNSLPTIFIAEVSSEAFGAGNEYLVQMDMRFASPGARFGQLETAFGNLAGDGGVQYLTRLIDPGRAAEYLLSSGTADAETAAALGWVNRAYGSVDEMNDAVDALAARIGRFSVGGLTATKRSIRDNSGPAVEALDKDLDTFQALATSPAAQSLADKWLVLSDNQSKGQAELGLDGSLIELYL